jgi:hypothetical protein
MIVALNQGHTSASCKHIAIKLLIIMLTSKHLKIQVIMILNYIDMAAGFTLKMIDG